MPLTLDTVELFVAATWLAACRGHQAGRAGLSVEEVADTPYLVRLRHAAERDRAAIAARLAEDLAALQARAGELDPEVLHARCRALVDEARAADRIRITDYELLCAAYGHSWRRHHRDRHFAHLGWRCPRLPDTGWKGQDDDSAR